MNPKEQSRLQVPNSLLAQHMTLDQAATLMGVSPRHIKRILAAYREKGVATLAHGHRGRRPANATSEAIIADAFHLARTGYAVQASCDITFSDGTEAIGEFQARQASLGKSYCELFAGRSPYEFHYGQLSGMNYVALNLAVTTGTLPTIVLNASAQNSRPASISGASHWARSLDMNPICPDW